MTGLDTHSRYDHYRDAAAEAVRRIGDRYWYDRIADMLMSAADAGKGRLVGIRLCRVSKSWPKSGSITFEREGDPIRRKLYMTKAGFKIGKAR